jgi:hypothetical protein
VLLADDKALREIEEAVQIAERASDDITLVLLRFALGVALIHRDGADRQRGLDTLLELRAMCIDDVYAINIVPGIDGVVARETALRGDLDGAVEKLRAVTDDLFECEYFWTVVPISGFFVETLVERCSGDDLAEAEAAIKRLIELPSHIDGVSREMLVLRLRALVARARGDVSTYRDVRDRYLAMATSLGFEGHIALGQEMT